MAVVKGIGLCVIPNGRGIPCGRQINEGEPIGTVMLNGPQVGHKHCVDGYLARQQEKKNMVKKFEQQGAGGAVDFGNPQEMVQGSIPLQAPEDLPSLSEVALPEGVRPVTEVPFEEAQEVPQGPGDGPIAGQAGSGQLGAAISPVGGIPQVANTITLDFPKEATSARITVEFL